MTITAPDRLHAARATLQAAEQRTGVRAREVRALTAASTASRTVAADVDDEVVEPFTAFLAGGRLPVEAVSVVAGSTSLLLATLAASQGEGWIAVAGTPALGCLAAAGAGIDLDRLIVVPDVHGRAADVVAALLDGMTYVVVGPDAHLTPADRRQLLARARDRGSGIVATDPWEHAALRVRARPRWSGADHGAGWLRTCTLDVEVQARGAPERWTVTLPTASAAPFVPPSEGSSRRRPSTSLHAVE